MAIKKEYVCFAHGAFESADDNPECPMGCDTVERAFFTPPALGSGRTKNIDSTFESLAKSHKLTDIGPGAMRRKALAAEKSQQAYREFCQRRYGGMGWGAVPDGGTFNAKTHEVTGNGPGAIAAAQHAGARVDVGVSEINKKLGGSIPARYIKDPDNLQLSNAA